MDSHLNKNVYPVNANKDNELYGGYTRTPCAQQSQASQRPQHQHFLPPPYAMSVPMSNNMPQQLMYNTQGQPMYNIMYGPPPQTMYRNQNSFPSTTTLNAFPQSMDPVSWVPEPCMSTPVVASKEKYSEKYNKYDDKPKDSSSGSTSCCVGRVENITCSPLSDVYKSVNKDLYYNKNSIMDPQWFYGSNYDNSKYNELPSCSQITSNNSRVSSNINECCNPRDTSKNIKSVKYCSIQKFPEPEPKLYMYPNKYENEMYINQPYSKSKDYSSCSQLPCNIYTGSSACLEIDKKSLLDPCDIILSTSNQGFYPQSATDCSESSLQPFDVPKIDKTTEESNGGGGESDIVVEDSDEETDESEVEKEELLPCLICNMPIVENQFFTITSDTPLTSFSRTKVSAKLYQLFNASTSTSNSSNNLCSPCMTLINTLDNLEIQLDTIRRELMEKYKTTMETLKLFINKQELKDLEQQSNEGKIGKVKSAATVRKYSRNKYKAICGYHSFKCRLCKKSFSLKKFYRYHMAKHKPKSSYLCERCGCKFVKHLNLLEHMRRHSNNFTCSLCNKICIKDQINQHKCNKIEKRFLCKLCGKTFKTKTNLTEHEHFCSGKLPYACNNCDKRFPSTTKLKQHINLKHDKNFTENCSLCGKGFVKHSDYKSHLLTHSPTKNYECKTCGKTYKTLSNLNHHAKIHNRTLPFLCSVCQKGFLRKENLESHLNIHNGVKPFNCSICDKKFASQKNLDAHLKVHNGTTKKKTCPVCGKKVSHGLDEHMRTHSSLKQFECVSCSLKFVTKGALAKHRKRKHENIELDV